MFPIFGQGLKPIARISTLSIPTTTSETPLVDEFENINSMGKKTEIFSKILDDAGYDTKLRPPGINGTGPTTVQVSLYVRSIENIDDVKMQYSVQTTFRQEWVDPRLK